jgi:hypothetical protein
MFFRSRQIKCRLELHTPTLEILHSFLSTFFPPSYSTLKIGWSWPTELTKVGLWKLLFSYDGRNLSAMGCSRAPTKDFIQFCKSPQKKNNLVKASILFYYRLSPNLIALETIQYRPPRAFRWFPSCPIHPPSLPRVFGWLLCLFIDWGPHKTTTKFDFLHFCSLIWQ